MNRICGVLPGVPTVPVSEPCSAVTVSRLSVELDSLLAFAPGRRGRGVSPGRGRSGRPAARKEDPESRCDHHQEGGLHQCPFDGCPGLTADDLHARAGSNPVPRLRRPWSARLRGSAHPPEALTPMALPTTRLMRATSPRRRSPPFANPVEVLTKSAPARFASTHALIFFPRRREDRSR
jgi:hypothetical protein